MLTDLHVRGLGVIPELSVRFEDGMTALTGETGAGKTLLVRALQLVLGGRATADSVREGEKEAFVEARFVSDAGETTLARTIPRTGRSRAWLDGRMAPLSTLADVAAGLVDICGQHDRQSLLSGRGQRVLLDSYAGADLGPLAESRRLLRDLRARAESLGGDARERARQADLLTYQVAEVDAARISDLGEERELESEELLLASVASLRSCAADALAALHGHAGSNEPGGASVVDRLSDAARAISNRPGGATRVGSNMADPARGVGTAADIAGFGEVEERLRAVVREVDDIETTLRRSLDVLEDDPVRLEAVQARRRFLAGLRRKYGESLAEVLDFASRAAASLEELGVKEREASELDALRSRTEARLVTERTALRNLRAEAAPRLAAAVGSRLRTLAMPDASFEVHVRDGGEVAFHLGANRGEATLPLADVASGGELARTMLALRLVVDGGAPTLLFDEVDAGVGGAAALALGASLHEVAERRQVLVVTHLPQVAAAADHQISVRKVLDGTSRAAVRVEPLDTDARVVELSRMLSGHPDSATARAHAEELLVARTSSPSARPPGRSR